MSIKRFVATIKAINVANLLVKKMFANFGKGIKMEVLTYREAAKMFKMPYSTFLVKTSRSEFAKFRVKETRQYIRKYRGKKSSIYRITNCFRVNEDFKELMERIKK